MRKVAMLGGVLLVGALAGQVLVHQLVALPDQLPLRWSSLSPQEVTTTATPAQLLAAELSLVILALLGRAFVDSPAPLVAIPVAGWALMVFALRTPQEALYEASTGQLVLLQSLAAGVCAGLLAHVWFRWRHQMVGSEGATAG